MAIEGMYQQSAWDGNPFSSNTADYGLSNPYDSAASSPSASLDGYYSSLMSNPSTYGIDSNPYDVGGTSALSESDKVLAGIPSAIDASNSTTSIGEWAGKAAPYIKAATAIAGLLAASGGGGGQSQRKMMHKMLAPHVQGIQARQNYLASLGIGAPAGQGGPPIYAASYAEGGPIKLSATIGGTPITAEIPAHHLAEFKEVGLGALRRFANGGLTNAIPTPPQGLYPQALIPQAQPKLGATPYRQEVIDGMARGGLLRGPGDGMSDDIPANIEGKEPARVADGEFVVPKEIVHIMDLGQPGHGAKVLDLLVREVRKRAHGHTKQINQGAGQLAAQKILNRAMSGGRV